MFELLSVVAPDFDCVVVGRGRDVLVLVAESLLTSRGAAAINAALRAADDRARPPEGAEA